MSEVPPGCGPHRKAACFGFRLCPAQNKRLMLSRAAAKKAARVEGHSTLAILDHLLVQLTEPFQHHRELGPRGGAGGIQPPVRGAVEDPCAAGPLHGWDRVP